MHQRKESRKRNYDRQAKKQMYSRANASKLIFCYLKNYLNRFKMVVVVYKKSEKNAFSVECTVDTKVSVLLTQLIESKSALTQLITCVSIWIDSSGVSKN